MATGAERAKAAWRWSRTMLMGAMLCGLTQRHALAGEFAFGVGYVGEHSSNIERVPEDERGEWSNSLIGGFAYRESTTDLVAHALAQVEYRDYREEVFPDEKIYNVDAAVIWHILPQQLSWIVEDRYAPLIQDATAAGTPADRIGSNVFGTGPEAYLRLGPADTAIFGARYGEASFEGEEDITDHTRYVAYGRWQHDATSITTLSLNAESLYVNFDDDLINDDFRRHDVFVRADVRPSRSRFVLDLGGTQINREREDDLDGPLLRLTWARQVTAESTAGITLAAEYSDVASALLATLTSPVAPTGPVVPVFAQDIVTGDIYYTRRAEVFYSRVATGLTFNASAFVRDFDYDLAEEDRRGTGGLLEFIRNLGPTTAIELFGEAVHTRFRDLDREDDDYGVGARLTYRASRTIELRLEGRKAWRESSDPAAEFAERVGTVSLLYSSGPLYTPVSRR